MATTPDAAIEYYLTAQMAGGPARAPEVHLPGRLNRLVGRGPELERVDALLDGSRLLTIVGSINVRYEAVESVEIGLHEVPRWFTWRVGFNAGVGTRRAGICRPRCGGNGSTGSPTGPASSTSSTAPANASSRRVSSP